MAFDVSKLSLLVAVGSRPDRVCSIGAFARAETRALAKVFKNCEMLTPLGTDDSDRYPDCKGVSQPDVILFHAPSLHDRKYPWNAIVAAAKIKRAFPEALFLAVVHEFSEAPLHWRIRQILIAAMAQGVITNSTPDFEGVRRWNSNVHRSPLGPTLFYEELLEPATVQSRALKLVGLRARERGHLLKTLASSYGLRSNEKWVLHPGLITPGKGVNFLGKLAPYLGPDVRLLVMGGQGPKQRDRDFADRTLTDLKEKLGARLTFVDSPDDETYRRFLVASDLVVLPYDAGLSERRSSFLSSMSCGANVWTTTGAFTGPLEIGFSGAHATTCEQWRQDDPAAMASIKNALLESDDEVQLRRIKNLAWAMPRSWQSRTQSLVRFIAASMS